MTGDGGEITIRRGRREDATTLAALHRDADWCYDDAAIVTEYYDDAFEPETVLAAEHDGALVGKLELFLGWKSTSGRFGLIRRFVVHPDWRGRGVGHRLLAAAEEEARRAGCSFLELSVDEDNTGARRLYGSQGFAEDRRELMLRKSLDGRTHPSHTKQRQAE
ncbi:MAG TPA: GNAT family N-acetyltransferase [Thermomicrobiales bacterium]|nr:GNAT family N-acetyltransferase [Thermomicrobiales bacterium]